MVFHRGKIDIISYSIFNSPLSMCWEVGMQWMAVMAADDAFNVDVLS